MKVILLSLCLAILVSSKIVIKRSENSYGDEPIVAQPSAAVAAPTPVEQGPTLQETQTASASDYGIPPAPSPDPTTAAPAAVQENVAQAYRRFMFKLHRMRMRRMRRH